MCPMSQSVMKFSSLSLDVWVLYFVFLLAAHVEANPIYLKYLKEKGTPRGCAADTAGLVTAVANYHFNTNLTVILFDELYYLDIHFKWILSDILTNLKYSTVMFGRKKSLRVKSRENERPSWVFFATQMEAFPGRNLLVAHSSPFQVKEWLLSPPAKKYPDIVALSDPAILKDGCDIGLYSHSLTGDSSFSASVLTAWRGSHFTRSGLSLYPDKMAAGYRGAHFKLALQLTPPFSFRRYHGLESYWDGIDVRLIKLLSERLNFTYELKGDNSELQTGGWVRGELKESHAELGLGRQTLTPASYKEVAFAYPHGFDCAGFVSLTSTALPKYRAIMGPFLWDVWIALIATYLLAMIPLAFSAWHTLRPLLEDPAEIETLFWYVFGTFTNLFTFSGRASWTRGSKNSTKVFIGTYWLFTIIVTACYTGSIIAFITLPVYPEVVDSMHQLLHKNYRVLTLERDGWWSLLGGATDDEASGLAGTAELVDTIEEGIIAVVESLQEDSPKAFFGSKEQLTYLIKTNYTNSKVGKRQMFHFSNECFITEMISIALPPDSIYLASINSALLRAAESGFIAKFYKDIEWDIYKSSDRSLLQGNRVFEVEERELTLDDTQGMFLLLGCGFALALIAWIFEVGTWAKGRDLTALGKEQLAAASRRISRAILEPSGGHFRLHYPLYFRFGERAGSSVFGSRVEANTLSSVHPQPPPPPALSEIHLRPLSIVEKPIRLLSF